MNFIKTNKTLIKTVRIHILQYMDTSRYISRKDKPYALTAILLGFLNHFLYDLSGRSSFTALFCPVNESVWEHLKLLFFPILFVSIVEYLRYRPETVRYFYYRFLAAISAMSATIMLFYTYTGIIGRDFFAADILIFLFSLFSAFYMDAYFYQIDLRTVSQTAAFSLWTGLTLCFFAFTCFPPDLPLFFSMSY